MGNERTARKLWLKNAVVWTGGGQASVFKGGVVVSGSSIEAVGPDDELERLADGARTMDTGGRLLVPGFINAHMHLYSALARGLSLPGEPPSNFSGILEKLWWRLDASLRPEDIAAGAELMLAESLRAGVTSVVDHHASYGAIRGSLALLADTARKLGVRLCTCFEVSDRHGRQRAREAIAENLEFARLAEGKPDIAAMFGMHASFTLSDETLAECRDAMKQSALVAHVHLAEDAADNEDARRRGFRSAADRLLKAGVLPEGSLAIHAVHTTPDDWAGLAEAGVVVVHNPQSNMNNAVGAAPLRRLMQSGIGCCIGTDGMEADVREELRAAYLLGRHTESDPRLMWPETSSLLENNRLLARRTFGLPIGVLEPGAAADVVVFDYHPPTPLTAGNFLGHLIFGFGRLPAWTVVTSGTVRIEKGEPTGFDPAEMATRARERAEALWKRM